MHGFEVVVGLVVVAIVVAALAARTRVPAPSLLVLVGVGVALIPGVPSVALSPEIVAFGVLPPLLYAGAADVARAELRSVIGAVSALAIGLVAASAVAVAFVAHAVFPQMSLATALVLGAVLASTDPVAVGALARRLQLPPRLLALLQGESLLNDATSLVLFRVAIGLATASVSVSVLDVGWQFVRLGGGGALFGIAVAGTVRRLRSRIHDPVLETTVAVVMPYSVYVGAEALGLSGVTAVVLSGLYLGERERGVGVSSGPARLQISAVYEVLQFLLESVIFAVIGLELPAVVRHLSRQDNNFVWGTATVIVALLVVRAALVYPVMYAQRWLPFIPALRRGTAPPWQVPAVLVWAGTRGVVPLAAALSIPVTVHGAAFPHRDLLLVVTTSAILVTLVGQGVSLEPMVRRLGVSDDPATRIRDDARARYGAARAALTRLDELLDVEAIPRIIATRLRAELEQQIASTEHLANGAADALAADAVDQDVTYRAVRRDLLAAQTAELLRLRADGAISETARRKVQRELDLWETGLGTD